MQPFTKQLIFLAIIAIVFSIGVYTVIAVNNRGNAPVAWWKFDEGYGATAFDAAGANDGTITNAAWRNEPDCKSGKCLSFDGTGDYVDAGTDSSLNFTTQNFTISFWLKLNAVEAKNVIYRSTGTDGYFIQTGSTNILYFKTNNTVRANTNSSLTTGVWCHVVAVYNQTSNVAQIYLNGIAQTSLSAPNVTGASTNFYISYTSSGINGFIDDVRIYDYARTASQIKADYLGGGSRGATTRVAPTETVRNASEGLVGHWKMDESSGNAADSSGSGLTLTNNGTTPFVAGKYGNAADFTPASSHNFSTATSVSSVKTVEFWVYPDSSTNNYFDLASGVYLTSSGGALTATGFTSPVIYVNGVATSIISASAWSHIAVVTNTGITSNAIAFGKANSAYFDGKLDDIKIYKTARSAEQIMLDYETGPPPVAHWKMDEKTGTSAQDTSDNTYTGTLTSGPTWASGKYGSAVNFDGSDDFIDVGPGPGTVNAISFWVYPATTTEYPIDLNGTAYIWVNAGVLTAQGFTSPTYYVNGIQTTTVVANQWQHIAVTTNTALNASDLDIGRIEGVGNHEGRIDDVRIYNYARTHRQILADMAGGQAQKQYAGYWNFDEAYGATAFDKSNNNNDGVITGADWTMNGKFGRALDFVSANSDWIDIGDLNTNIETISFWANLDSTTEKIMDFDTGTHYIEASSGILNLAGDTSERIYVDGIQTTAITAGSWHHIVVVASAGFDANNVDIGRSGATYLDGVLDEVKIYAFALTPAEIKQEYNRGAAMVLGSERNSSSVWDDGGFGGAAPVAWWKMDEKTDNTCSGGTNDVCDVSGNSNDGANTGGPTWKSAGQCKQGSCLGFDGWDDYVDYGSPTLLDDLSVITYSAWVYPKGTAPDTNNYGRIINKTLTDANTGKIFAFDFDSNNNRLSFSQTFSGGQGNWVLPVGSITLNTWQHVAVIYDSSSASNDPKIYINGVSKTITETIAPTGTASSDASYNLLIGDRGDGMRNLYGSIDNVRIYNYARTPAQIAYDYNHGKAKLHWKFDENTGNTAYDYYKTKNGDLTGHSPDWTGGADQCKFNYCLDFVPANSDYVDVGNTGIGANLYSVSFWIYPDSVVSQNIMDFDAGTHKITTDASGNLTANGWSSPTYYKNGIVTTSPSLTASTWQHIMITTATAFSPSDTDFGRVSASYFDGRLDEIKFYTYPLTAAQVKQDYQGGAVRFGPGSGLP